MIRKVIITMTALAAVAVLITSIVSQRTAIHWDASIDPGLSLAPGSPWAFLERLSSAEQRWLHAVVVRSHVTVLYGDVSSPPFTLLPRSVEAAFFDADYRYARIGFMLEAGERCSDGFKGDLHLDGEYRESSELLRKAASLRFDRLLGSAPFVFRHKTVTGGHQAVVRFPLWMPLIVFLTYPAIAFIRGPLRRHLRRKKGLCVKCGYDLRGSVSGVCSECGETM